MGELPLQRRRLRVRAGGTSPSMVRARATPSHRSALTVRPSPLTPLRPSSCVRCRQRAEAAAGPGTRIVDGEVFDPVERHPHKASLMNTPSSRRVGAGGGDLVHPRVVLAAAHCRVHAEEPPPTDGDGGRGRRPVELSQGGRRRRLRHPPGPGPPPGPGVDGGPVGRQRPRLRPRAAGNPVRHGPGGAGPGRGRRHRGGAGRFL